MTDRSMDATRILPVVRKISVFYLSDGKVIFIEFQIYMVIYGLVVACWPLVPKFAGSNPAEAVGFLGAKKSSAPLPSEGK